MPPLLLYPTLVLLAQAHAHSAALILIVLYFARLSMHHAHSLLWRPQGAVEALQRQLAVARIRATLVEPQDQADPLLLPHHLSSQNPMLKASN
jgi:hypothetical protein